MVQKQGVTRTATVIIAVIATAYALYWLRGILTPLALAMFLMVMVDGFARTLAKYAPFLPEWAALPVALAISAVSFGLIVYAVAANAAGFGAELFDAAPRLNVMIAQVAHFFRISVPPTVQQLINQLNPIRYLGNVASALQAFGGTAAYVLIYFGFLIASRAGFAKKVEALYPVEADREHATQVFVRIRNGVERYLWIQTVTGALIAVLAWALMAVLNLESALFWAFLIFIVCYIPVIGGFIAGVLPALFALVQFPTLWPAGVLFAGLQIILFVVGNVVLPRMQRDSLNIDPVVVLLSLAFWGAIWGVVGMFLSTPLTVMGIIVLAQFPGTRWIAILLSGDGEPDAQPILTPPPRLPGPDEASGGLESAAG
ncbi:MAG: AI-2E family transporter [Caulobacterales bacterium 32-69-10]|nr:MAG: AI-2E family transporter [Caulobacterales bacterium 32-69-10]